VRHYPLYHLAIGLRGEHDPFVYPHDIAAVFQVRKQVVLILRRRRRERLSPQGGEELPRTLLLAGIRAATEKPVWAKLSPNAGDIVAIAEAAEKAGADALVVSNTILGLKIEIDTFRPAIGNKFGGISGPGIKPIIVRMVYQCAKAVSIPIIGCGGICKVEDVVEYMLAGASAVAVGYATFRNPTAMIALIDGLGAWCDERGIARVADLTGAIRDEVETDTYAAASHM